MNSFLKQTLGLVALLLITPTLHANNDASHTLYQAPVVSNNEAAPAGFTPIYTELVARHGARGLMNPKKAEALLALWSQAQKKNALTPLGKTLGPAIETLMKGNQKIGYAQLSAIGIEEHQQLAVRLYQRMRPIFTPDRSIVYVSSGIPRAAKSAEAFVESLHQQNPKLTILKTPALITSPKTPVTPEPAGVNPFLLYFHELKKHDLIKNPPPNNPYTKIVDASLEHQKMIADKKSPANIALKKIETNPESLKTSHAVLKRLFKSRFLKSLTPKKQLTTAQNLYGLYTIAPTMKQEANFNRYFSNQEVAHFAYLSDAKQFYLKGPSLENNKTRNDAMAQMLLDDFFNQIDAIERGDLSQAAKLRFTHAEIIIPFASLLDLPEFSQAMPEDKLYTYANNPWRGDKVTPFAANIQWDVYHNAAHQLLVKMLYNEKDINFKAACNGARYGKTHFYDYEKLAICYGHTKT